MKLTAEDFEKLETKELANIIRKLGAGGTLTKREEEKLQRAREKQNGSDNRPSGSDFVSTWDELARVLTQRAGVSVSRKAIQNWRNPREFPHLAGKLPEPRADGRHNVSEWLRAMIENGLHRADEVVGDGEIHGKDRKSVRDWKMYREELQCREAERRIARGDNLLLVAADLEMPIGAMLAAINSKLALFPPRAARFMVMKRDVADAEMTLRDEMDAVIADLNLAGYIDTSIDDVVSEFPFDDETAALYAKVSFDGHDRAGFVELIRRSVEETLRRIGRRVLSVGSDQSTVSEIPHKESSDVAPEATSTSSSAHDSAAHGDKSRDQSSPSDASQSPPSVKSPTVTPRRKRGGKAKRT